MPKEHAPPTSGETPGDGVPLPAASPQHDAGPDERTTLANERTLLAWFRTALALLAASFIVIKLADITPRALRLALTCYLIALAMAVTIAGYLQWRTRQAHISGPERLSQRLSALALAVALLLLAGFVITVTILAP